MDLIYTDKNKNDVGVLLNYDMDIDFSFEKDMNTFQIVTTDGVLEKGSIVYVENTEYGGIVDDITYDSAKKTYTVIGRTFRGLFEDKIFTPDNEKIDGLSMATMQGKVAYTGYKFNFINVCIQKAHYETLFSLGTYPPYKPGDVSRWLIDRYIDVYHAMVKLLNKWGMKVNMHWNRDIKKIQIDLDYITDYTEMQELTSDKFDFKIQQKVMKYNHVIGLGRGELLEREVVDKYLDHNGNITDSQEYEGEEERTFVYDYPNVESLEELVEKSEEELLKYAETEKVVITANNLNADLGDKFSAYEQTTGYSAVQYVVSKAVKLTNNSEKVTYKIGGIS